MSTRPETPVPDPLLSALSRRVELMESRRSRKQVQEYDQKLQAQLVAGSWSHSLNSLCTSFEHAQVNLAHEPSAYCSALADAFGEGARQRIKNALRAVNTAQQETEKEEPSLQMVKQALNFACGELRGLHDDMARAVREGCDFARQDYYGQAMQPILTDSAMKAVDGLQGLLLSLEAQTPELVAVLEREAKGRVK